MIVVGRLGKSKILSSLFFFHGDLAPPSGTEKRGMNAY